MIRYSILAFGRVQGVGFRFFTQMKAANLNLTGWCKNLSDGSVKIEVQGKEEDLSKFILEIKKGNGFARVDDMEIKNIPVIENERKYSSGY